MSRKLDDDLQEQIRYLKRNRPRMSAAAIYRQRGANSSYGILYYSCLSPRQFQNKDEIIESLRPHIANISRRAYYQKRPDAVQVPVLSCWDIL